MRQVPRLLQSLAQTNYEKKIRTFAYKPAMRHLPGEHQARPVLTGADSD
jgi:hypothetical protein